MVLILFLAGPSADLNEFLSTALNHRCYFFHSHRAFTFLQRYSRYRES
jgi:hypothetical protein